MQFFSPRSWRNLMFMIRKGNFRPATYNAYFYPDYQWQPIVSVNGIPVNWREFEGHVPRSDEAIITETNQQLTLF